MATFQEIELALMSVNDAVFQELCDDYLFWSEEGNPAMNRPGSQKGKKKTKKGTPDCYWVLPSGKYVFAEHTTKNKKDGKAAFLQKLKDDIKKCLSPAVTKVQHSQIQKIILCFNSEILPSEIEQLKKLLSKTRITLQVKSLDTLARDIYGRFQHLALRHLNLRIDTGQFLKPEIFIEEHLSGGSLSTPLNNKFFHRVDELSKISTELQTTDVLILTGSPGVGKSKLALTVLQQWISSNNSFEGYCISNKYVPIHDDLKSYIANGKNYIILIDDANRQSQNLLQILAHRKSHSNGKLKIIITVRDYAYDFIKQKCNETNYSTISIAGFTDEQIEEILKSDDFKVTNRLYVKRILEIAKGNPRVAIMAARLALKHQKLDVLYDLFEFYDSYFHSFIKDNEVFNNKSVLKTLGVVSFFYSIDVSNKIFYDGLLENFEISHSEFTEAASMLEGLELFESSSDNTIVRISDQILSAYFFYKTFLVDKHLDFKKLLFIYFDSHPNRFSDTIIPANNDFGYENVLKPVEQTLQEYLQHVSLDNDKMYKVLDVFWFYLKDETFSFVHTYTDKLPAIGQPVYIVDKKSNNQNWSDDRIIKLLSKFFYQSVPEVADAIELTLNYVSKKPDLYKNAFKAFSDTFCFSYEDERLAFYRQAKLVSVFASRANKKNKAALHMFYDLAPVLLKTHFTVHGGSWKRNTISFYRYNLPATDSVLKLRAKIWNHLYKVYPLNRAGADEAIFEYIKPSMDNVKEVLEQDLPYLLKLIFKYFSSDNFLHCYFVQKLIQRYTRLNIKHKSFDELGRVYYSKAYKIYKLVDGSRLRNKEDYEYENIDYTKFERLKEIEIRYNLRVSAIEEFKDFYKTFVDISTNQHIQSWNFNNALDILIHETYLKDKNLALKCLNEIQIAGNKTWFNPFKILAAINEDSIQQQAYYKKVLAKNLSYNNHHGWMFSFLQFLKPEFVTPEYYQALLTTYNSLKTSAYFDFSYIDKFNRFDANIYKTLLKIFIRKADENLNPRLDFHFFEKYLPYFKQDLSIAKRVYFICEQAEQHFDHDCKDFLQILKLDSSFLNEYLNSIAKDKYSLSSRDFLNLSIIWQLPDAEKLILSAFKFLKGGKFYFVGEHFANCFFKNLDETNKKKATKFLLAYQKKNNKSVEVVNMVLDIYRHSLNDKYQYAITKVIQGNTSIDFFKKLELLSNFFSGSGVVIWDDVRAEELEKILQTVNKLPKSYQYSPHKVYLKALINICKNNADIERKRKFLDDRW